MQEYPGSVNVIANFIIVWFVFNTFSACTLGFAEVWRGFRKSCKTSSIFPHLTSCCNSETHQSYYRVFIQWVAIVTAVRKQARREKAGRRRHDGLTNDGKAILSFSTGKIFAVLPWFPLTERTDADSRWFSRSSTADCKAHKADCCKSRMWTDGRLVAVKERERYLGRKIHMIVQGVRARCLHPSHMVDSPPARRLHCGNNKVWT